MESYGAGKAFDYYSPTCGEDTRVYTIDILKYVLAVNTEARTIRHNSTVYGRGGGKYCGFELVADDLITTMRKSTKAERVMGLEMIGLDIDLSGGYQYQANPEEHAWICVWIERYAALFAAGKRK